MNAAPSSSAGRVVALDPVPMLPARDLVAAAAAAAAETFSILLLLN